MPRGARAWTRDAVSMELDGAWWFEFRETPPLNAPKYYEYAHNEFCPLPSHSLTLPHRVRSAQRRAASCRRIEKRKCYATPLLRRLATSLAPSLCLLMPPRPRRFAARWPGSGAAGAPSTARDRPCAAARLVRVRARVRARVTVRGRVRPHEAHSAEHGE